MDLTQNDFKETSELEGLILQIDNIDAKYINVVSDEIFTHQPFFLSVLLGYRFDTSAEELEEIMKVYFLIWEYFKNNKQVQTEKLTATHFERIQQRNIEMLNYAAGETGWEAKMEIYSVNIQNLKSKALLAAVFFRFKTRPVLLRMETEKKGIILIGIKTFIECFENL